MSLRTSQEPTVFHSFPKRMPASGRSMVGVRVTVF
jgi:hypothetical protein